ncbi:serine/threonine-protein kinase [Roseateles sp.]|uniref:serine/threonine-protein kinase n=1 Tax=Roseateles sp. TaxID=1971397 RepID=UPI003266F045
MKSLANEWPAINQRLDEALALAPDQREIWLESIIETATVKDMLRRLLHAAPGIETSDFLQALPKLTPAPAEMTPLNPVDAAFAGAVIGPYRLLRELGVGGMGEVWLAERVDGGLKRRVALKLPRLSWSSGLAERMSRERDILASLDHPNIARIHDAGLDEHGRPYLALEYVEGEAIDVHCKKHALSVPGRLMLVLQVARAVAHAHARLVVHRDLKPANILVTAEGQVRLLDFGIAKLMEGELTRETQLTRQSGRALTLDYASPEQIRGEPIGTASDVYSLGVVAYELLTDAKPYQLKRASAAALEEAIASVDVRQASAAATSPGARSALKGDLDAILNKALQKNVAERYPTVDALADDIERYLGGKPVLARPDSLWYRSDRWVRRHKVETAVAVALVVAALGGAYAQVLVLLALGGGAIAAFWQRNRALAQAERARAALARAEQVKGFIASIFTQAVPRAGRGGAVTAADLLQAAARRVETDLAAQPEVAAELGVLIGASFIKLGEARAGLEWLPKVVAHCTRVLGPTHPLSLQSRMQLAVAANTVGDLSVSEPLLPPLVRDLRNLQPPQPALLVAVLESQAFVHTKRGREKEAMEALNDAVEIAVHSFGEASEGALASRVALSNTFAHFRRNAEALIAITPALAPARAAYGASRPHPMLVTVELNHASALARNDRPREAAAMLRQVLADQRALEVDETIRVRVAMCFLGTALLLGGHLAEADALLVQADALHERLTGGANSEAMGMLGWRGLVAALRGEGQGALQHIARADEMALQWGEAEVIALERASVRVLAQATAGASAQALAGADALDGALPRLPGTSKVRLLRARAMALRHAGSAANAVAAAEQALEAAAQGGCWALEHGLALAEAARCHLAAGATAEAERLLRAALSVWEAGQVDGIELLQPAQLELKSLRT